MRNLYDDICRVVNKTRDSIDFHRTEEIVSAYDFPFEPSSEKFLHMVWLVNDVKDELNG